MAIALWTIVFLAGLAALIYGVRHPSVSHRWGDLPGERHDHLSPTRDAASQPYQHAA